MGNLSTNSSLHLDFLYDNIIACPDLGPPSGNMEDLLDRTFWRQFGAAILAPIGANLAPNWRCFGAKLAPIWRQLAPIGGSWRSVGAKFWRQLAPTPIGAKNFISSSRFHFIARQLAPIGAKLAISGVCPQTSAAPIGANWRQKI